MWKVHHYTKGSSSAIFVLEKERGFRIMHYLKKKKIKSIADGGDRIFVERSLGNHYNLGKEVFARTRKGPGYPLRRARKL